MVKKIQKQRHTGIVGGELLEKLETFHWISGWGRIPPSRLSQSQLIPTSDQVGTPQPPVHGRDVRWVSCCTNVNWSVRCGRSILVLSYKYSSCSSTCFFKTSIYTPTYFNCFYSSLSNNIWPQLSIINLSNTLSPLLYHTSPPHTTTTTQDAFRRFFLSIPSLPWTSSQGPSSSSAEINSSFKWPWWLWRILRFCWMRSRPWASLRHGYEMTSISIWFRLYDPFYSTRSILLIPPISPNRP